MAGSSTKQASQRSGVLCYSDDEIDSIVEYFGDFWHGQDYDPFAKNCNDFTHIMIQFLCNKE